jgi:hypothetical protein
VLLSSCYVKPQQEKSEQALWEESQKKGTWKSPAKGKEKQKKRNPTWFLTITLIFMQETAKGYAKWYKKHQFTDDSEAKKDP